MSEMFEASISLEDEFRKYSEKFSEEIEREVKAGRITAAQAKIWRKVPDLHFDLTIEKFHCEVAPGAAQLSCHMTRDREDEYRVAGVSDLSIILRCFTDLHFDLLEDDYDEGAPEIATPVEGLQCYITGHRLDVVVNCYPASAPVAMVSNDLQFMKDTFTWGAGDYHQNSAENILLIVEDPAVFRHFRKTCNVVLFQDGRWRDHALDGMVEWIREPRSDAFRNVKIPLEKALKPARGGRSKPRP